MKVRILLLTTTTTICISLIVFILSYNAAILISPPYTIINGRRYGTMPIPQLIVAIAISVIVFIPVFIPLFKKIKTFVNKNYH